MLDTDTREYLQLLVNGLGRGLEGRGGDLRDLLARFEPTHRDLARVNGAVATRRKQLRHLVTLAQRALARSSPRATTTSPSSSTPPSAVFDSFAKEQANVSSAVQRAAEHAAADDRHARPRRDVRRAARPDDREAAPGGARARPRQRGGAPVRQGGDAAAAQEHPPVRARVAPARARPAPGLRAARQGRARTSRRCSCASTTSSTCSATTRAARRARTTRPARRATCSGWRG